MKNFKYLLLLALIAYGDLFSTAFMRKEGEFFVSTEYWTYQTSRYWNKEGRKLPAHNKFVKKQFNYYMEYGVTPKDTITGKAMYDWISQTAHPYERGFEDFELTWRHQLKKTDDYIYSGEMLIIVPAGPNNKPAIRYGRGAIQLSLLHGRTFKLFEKYGFMDMGLGYRLYQGFPSDQVRGFWAIGYDFLKSFQAITLLTAEIGVFNGKQQVDFNIITQDPNYRLLKLHFVGRWRWNENISSTIGYYRHIWGQNTGTGGGWIAGFWFEW